MFCGWNCIVAKLAMGLGQLILTTILKLLANPAAESALLFQSMRMITYESSTTNTRRRQVRLVSMPRMQTTARCSFGAVELERRHRKTDALSVRASFHPRE